jgi:hypothetical protein
MEVARPIPFASLLRPCDRALSRTERSNPWASTIGDFSFTFAGLRRIAMGELKLLMPAPGGWAGGTGCH